MLTIDSLPTSVFGYRKSSVCEYIAQINEEFSQNVLEKDQYYLQQIKILQEKIKQLENENLRMKERQMDISRAIMDAHSVSEQIISSAENKAAKVREKSEIFRNEEVNRLKDCRESIEEFKNSLRELFEQIDSNLNTTVLRVKDLCEKLLKENYEIKQEDENSDD